MIDLTPIHKTRILPLRWFAHMCERISAPHLLKAVYLDEDNNYGFRYKYHAKMWSILFKPYQRWGTTYQVDMDKWIEYLENDPVLEKLGSDYDEDGVAYWEKYEDRN